MKDPNGLQNKRFISSTDKYHEQIRNESGGDDFYVNSNLSATAGDGSSWEKAFKTLAEAVAASNVKIALGAASD